MIVPYQLVKLQDLYALLDTTKVVLYDSETIGLYGAIRLAQFYQDGNEYVYLVDKPNAFELAALLQTYHIVGHNIHYDFSTLQDNLGINWSPGEFDDTFLLSRLMFYAKESFSLDNVITYVLGYNPYENKKEMQGSDWSVPVLSSEQLNYAASDVYYLSAVWKALQPQLSDINYKLDKLTLKYCLDFQTNGMPIDIDALNERYVANCARINEIGLTINCNSYQQVRAYINSTQSDDKGLALLASQGNEKAIQVRETRKLKKNNSFLTKFTETMRDGCIFGKFKLTPRSGRLSSDDQNLQQLPRSLKGIFGFEKDSDEVIIFSDFAQMQLRNVCAVTADKAMETLFREGKDLHSYVATLIFGENYTKEKRQIAKTANFSLLFGSGSTVFATILLTTVGLVLPEEQAAAIKKKWLTLWAQIKQWQDRGIRDWKAGRIWETPLGRKYTANMMTDQLAMQIQGFEAEVAKLALHYMYNKIKELNALIPENMPKFKLRNMVHDCYLFSGPNIPELYEQCAKIIADSMQEAWREMCKNVAIKDLPMPVNVKVGFNWGKIDKDKNDGGEYVYELNQ